VRSPPSAFRSPFTPARVNPNGSEAPVLKVLIVDDEPIIADTLVDILRGEGYDSFAVSNGESAVKWVGLFRPDVVVSDVIMPGMNGVEAAKVILRTCPECRIILFSGQAASVDLLEKARHEGFEFEVLAKPINPSLLLHAIASPGKTRKLNAS
jgi:CheY-like chemotaxis protein